METITEEKIRTLLVPVQTTETREVNIALPYFCKTHEFTSPTLFMVGEKGRTQMAQISADGRR